MLGVLMVNAGTPRSLHARDVRRFLGQFLSNRRVVKKLPQPCGFRPAMA